MFRNIGGKIKTLARVLCWIGIIVSVIISVSLFSSASRIENDKAFAASYASVLSADSASALVLGTGVSGVRAAAFVMLIGGPLVSWLGCFVLYGFGELIDRTAAIDRKVSELQQAESVPAPAAEKEPEDGPVPEVTPMQALDVLLANGLISPEKYERKKEALSRLPE